VKIEIDDLFWVGHAKNLADLKGFDQLRFS
jgi:hypothetical protein